MRLLLLCLFIALASSCHIEGFPAEVDMVFAPGCEGTEVAAIKSARTKIRVMIYSFTSRPICDALIAAKARGVDVQVLMDEHAARGTNRNVCTALINAGVPLKLDAKHAIMHMKMTIIDGETVLCGSFNYSKAAEHRNAELMTVIKSADVAEQCNAIFNLHANHSP